MNILTLELLAPEQVHALESSPHGPFGVLRCTHSHDLAQRLQRGLCDALLVGVDDASSGLREIAELAALDTATLVVTDDRSPETLLRWLRHGAQDVLAPAELGGPALAQRVRAAIERKRLERDARKAYATDLATGLPHQQQLIEHMSHLMALREREPSPMAVLVLRIEGLASTEARLGREAAQVLRRKVAVRLRAGVRASDVVAAIGEDSFAVLLGAMLAPADATRVGAKLLKALQEPFNVTGTELAVGAALGIAQYPPDGSQPELLLRRAVGLAAAAPAEGRAGFGSAIDAAGRPPEAANDE